MRAHSTSPAPSERAETLAWGMSTDDLTSPAIAVSGLRHRYGDREALRGIDLAIRHGEIFGLVGPNGGGKTTLVKVLATLIRPQAGSVRILGDDAARAVSRIRRQLGVVFQRPSVDSKLTVLENLRCHAALYGLDRADARERANATLARLDVADRAHDRVDTLSGGLARRIELAKALLHRPMLLVLDEASTGLDPKARREFLQHVVDLRDTAGVTVVLTTHFMDEAERCDRIAFLDRGVLVTVGSPAALKAEIGGDVVVVHATEPERLAVRLRQHFGCAPRLVDGALRVELPRGHEFAREVMERFANEIQSVTFGKPTLEDVFVRLTGHRFDDAASPVENAA